MKQKKGRAEVILIVSLCVYPVSMYPGLDSELSISKHPGSSLKNKLEKRFLAEALTFNLWKNFCLKLPRYDESIKNPFETLLDKDLFEAELERFFDTMEERLKNGVWIGEDPQNLFVDASPVSYVQKIIIDPNARVAIHGDVHGDVHLLNTFIQMLADEGYLEEDDPFKISDPQFYIIFLGDYIDRGWYGVEVLYTLLCLKNRNPDRVFLIRGNHEDILMNRLYGFLVEFENKFGQDSELVLKLMKMYTYLPLLHIWYIP